MKTSDLSFELPPELIAQSPSDRRGGGKLMIVDRARDTRTDSAVDRLPELLDPGTVMVFNDSRVLKSRVYGRPVDRSGDSPAQEFLLTRRIATDTWLAIGRNARKLTPGRLFAFSDGVEAEIVEMRDQYRVLRFSQAIDGEWLQRYGHVPLPPYIDRPDAELDEERYQTVYARSEGSVAAPTAGLHFTPDLLDRLTDRGITTCRVTLHVGIGTFFPIRSETVEAHTMHAEEFYLSPTTAEIVECAKRERRRVVAVGTTTVRTLESAWNEERGALDRGHRSTQLYIYPGYRFAVVDSIFTNFHTPESTLLAMVSAFAGRSTILASYREAIQKRYRFYSYGDAMLIV